jgi:subtilisin family serine protease
LQPGANIAAIDAAAGTTLDRADTAAGLYRVALPPGSDPASEQAALLATPGVAAAEPDQPVNLPEAAQGSGPFYQASLTAANYMGQYALGLIGATAAQSITTGTGTIIAVLDTGVTFTHPALAGHLLPGYNVLSPGARPADVPTNVASNANDAVGHGTAVAGIIAAVAPGASIMPIKVLDSDGWGTEFGLAEGIRYAVQHGANVINLSLGMAAPSAVVAQAINDAAQHGVVVVAAAGNTGSAAPTFPASAPHTLAVAATDATDAKAPFSAYGAFVGVSAPGVAIDSAYYTGGYAWWSGTSMAAPFVSGEVALIRAALRYESVSDIVARVRGSADPIDARNPGFAGRLGTGRINLRAAVAAPHS